MYPEPPKKLAYENKSFTSQAYSQNVSQNARCCSASSPVFYAMNSRQQVIVRKSKTDHKYETKFHLSYCVVKDVFKRLDDSPKKYFIADGESYLVKLCVVGEGTTFMLLTSNCFRGQNCSKLLVHYTNCMTNQ